jgi:hypothetical protein
MEQGATWLAQAQELLAAIRPDLEGEVLQQQAALALMQAHREGTDGESLERVLQAVVMEQLALALRSAQG